MHLGKRLATISNMIATGSIVADVGSDHGKLIISLFENCIITKGYAIENKKGPYTRLVKAITDAKMEDHIVPLFSDGITDLPTCVDTVVIAGMGGTTIVDILKKNQRKLDNVSTIVVDAHNAVPQLREEISKLGYAIADEKIVEEEEIFYEIIKFIKSDIAFYGEKDLEFGPILRVEKSPLFKEKYENRIKEIDHLLDNNVLPEKRMIELTKEKERIRGIL